MEIPIAPWFIAGGIVAVIFLLVGLILLREKDDDPSAAAPAVFPAEKAAKGWAEESETTGGPWYRSPLVMALALLLFWPAFLVILWLNPKTKQSTKVWVTALCLAVVIGFLSGGMVEYQVYGDPISAHITYYNGSGGIEQVESHLPFQKTVFILPGFPTALVAQNPQGGEISCRVKRNGITFKRATSTAVYGVVTC